MILIVIHLDKVFQYLIKHGMTLKFSKCKFFQEEIQFLIYQISNKGISPIDEKLEAIKLFNYPKNLKNFSFLSF